MPIEILALDQGLNLEGGIIMTISLLLVISLTSFCLIQLFKTRK